ncbi:exonuclease [Streptomyces phage GreenWeasel]|nr:exonuclease [Streptomyces phage GreenWeasel]
MSLNLLEIPSKPVHPNHSVPRDGWGRPIVVPRGGGKPKGYTRTTTFIDCIEDKSALIDWGKRMVLVGTTKRPDLMEKARPLDPEDPADKKRLNELAEQATDASGANAKRERGTHLHNLSELVDAGQPLPASASAQDVEDMGAYLMETSVLKVRAVEQFVVVDELGVAGTFDRMAEYDGPGPDGEPISGSFICDLKTGSVEYGGLKMAAQLACYSRGVRYDFARFPVNAQDKAAVASFKKRVIDIQDAEAAYSPLPPVNQDWGIIIHLPAGEGECTLYWVDLNIGWEAAELALRIRELRSKGRKAMKRFVTQDTANEVASTR